MYFKLDFEVGFQMNGVSFCTLTWYGAKLLLPRLILSLICLYCFFYFRCIRSFIIKSIYGIVQARSGNAYATACISDVGARNNLVGFPTFSIIDKYTSIDINYNLFNFRWFILKKIQKLELRLSRISIPILLSKWVRCIVLFALFFCVRDSRSWLITFSLMVHSQCWPVNFDLSKSTRLGMK